MSAIEKRSRFAEAGKEDGFARFLATSHAKSTQADYARVWERVWPVFLASIQGDEDEGVADLYLCDVPGELEKSNVWARFIYHLRAVVRVPVKRVGGQLSAVKTT